MRFVLAPTKQKSSVIGNRICSISVLFLLCQAFCRRYSCAIAWLSIVTTHTNTRIAKYWNKKNHNCNLLHASSLHQQGQYSKSRALKYYNSDARQKRSNVSNQKQQIKNDFSRENGSRSATLKKYHPYSLEHYEVNYEEEESQLKNRHVTKKNNSTFYSSEELSQYTSNGHPDTAAKQKMEDDTNYILYRVPIGQLSPSNMVTIQYLMYGWANVAATTDNSVEEFSESDPIAVQAATIVEMLIKRILDDFHAGNKLTSTVTLKMYHTLVRAWCACCDDPRYAIFAQQRIRQIINNLQSLYETTGDISIQPDAQIFNYLLNIMSTSSTTSSTSAAATIAARDAEDIISHMNKLYITGVNTLLLPDAVSYTALINVYVKSLETYKPLMVVVAASFEDTTMDAAAASGEAPEARKKQVVNRVLEIFNKLQEKFKATGDIKFRPNKFTYSAVINCLAKCGYAKKADELLMEMLTLAREAADNNSQDSVKYDIAPNIFVFNTVLYAYSHIGSIESAKRAEEILMDMEQQQHLKAIMDDEVNNRPNIMTYNHVMYAWANCCSSEAEQHQFIPRAEAILQRLLDRSSSDEQNLVKPDKRSYTIILFAWTKRSYLGKESVEKAESFLLRMLNHHELQHPHQSPALDYPFDAVSYSLVMHAWGRTRLCGAAQRAEHLLLDMQRRYESGIQQLKPTTRTFTALLDAWSKSPEAIAVQRAEDILHQMHVLSDSGNIDLYPDVFCYTIVIGCLAKSGLGKVGAQRAEQILNYMESQHQQNSNKAKPNVRTYNAVIDAWSRARCDESPARCDQLLHRIIQLYENGDQTMAPETFTFNAVMNVWTNRGVGDVSGRVKKIFNQMLAFYHSGINSCAPDERTYTVLLKGSSICLDGDEKCSEVLYELISSFENGKIPLAPTFTCFKSVIELFTRSQRDDSARKAGEILQLMVRLYEDGWADVYPSPFCFRQVIASFAYDNVQPESVVNATMVLRQMNDAFHEGLIDSKPNAHDYIIVLNAWAKSKLPRKAVYAEQVLRDLLKECRPGNEYSRAIVSAYTIVMNSCAFAAGDLSEQQEAFAIAKSCLWEMCHSIYGKPNFVAFGTFLKACGRLDIPVAERNANIRAAFQMACEHQEANDFVFAQLRYAAPNSLYTELVNKARIPKKVLVSNINTTASNT